MFCGGCGNEIGGAAKYCAHCGCANIAQAVEGAAVFSESIHLNPSDVAVPLYQQSFIPAQEFLQSGNDPAALSEMKGWNWGAFFLSWIWAFSHEQMAAGVIILVGSFIPFIGFIIRWSFKIYLGTRGSELAWRTRRFASVQQFRDTQRVWTIWGGVIFGLNFAFYLLIVFFYFGSMFYSGFIKGFMH